MLIFAVHYYLQENRYILPIISAEIIYFSKISSTLDSNYYDTNKKLQEEVNF